MKLMETYVYISAKDDALKAGLKNASRYARKEVSEMQKMLDSLSFKSFNLKNLVVGAASLWGAKAAIDQLVGSTVTAGSSFNDMSARLNVSVENLSALDYMAKLTGTDMGAVEKSVRFLTNSMLDVSRGSGTAKKTFEEMGIAVMGANGQLRPVMDLLMDAADRLAGMSDATKQAAYAADLFGARTGTMLLPMLKGGSAEMRKMYDEAKRLGIVMSTEDAAAADAAGDAMDTFGMAIEGVRRTIAAGILPTLTSYVTAATEWVSVHREAIKTNVKEWLDRIGAGLEFLWKHRETIKTVFEIALITAVTAKLLTLAAVITKVAGALVALGAGGGLAATLKVLNGTAIAGTIAALSNPVGLAVLGTIAAGGAVAVGAGLIRDHLQRVESLKFANVHQLAEDIGKVDVNNLKGAKLPSLTEAEWSKQNPGGDYLTLGGFKNITVEAGKAAAAVGKVIDKERELFGFGMGIGFGTFAGLRVAGAHRDFSYGNPMLGAAYAPPVDNSAVADAMFAGFKKNQDIIKDLKGQLKDTLDTWKDQSIEFSNFWGDTMFNMLEKSRWSMGEIAKNFGDMVRQMVTRAALAGLFNLIFGGAGGFMGGFRGSLALPASPTSVPVSPGIIGAGKAAGPIMSGGAGKIAGNTDNSRVEMHFHDAPVAAMSSMDPERFARTFKECVRDGRIKVTRTS